jgi:hypothetical protein
MMKLGAASRHFVALSAGRMIEWMGAGLSGLDIMVHSVRQDVCFPPRSVQPSFCIGYATQKLLIRFWFMVRGWF